MKEKIILSSILLGLTLPAYALPNVSLPVSLSRQLEEQVNKIGTGEVAQTYVSLQQVEQRLYNSQSQILNIARQFSGDRVRWDYISVEYPNSQQIKLNIHGNISKPGKDAGIRIGLYFQADYQGNYRVIGQDWHTSKSCRRWCDEEVEKYMRQLPNKYPSIDNHLRNMLY